MVFAREVKPVQEKKFLTEGEKREDGGWFLYKILIFIIQLITSLKNYFFPSQCKFIPSCSCYTQQAIIKYGVFKGILKSLWRIIRCNPFSRGGFDPVK